MNKRQSDIVNALQEEGYILQSQVDSYKMLAAELKTENRDVK